MMAKEVNNRGDQVGMSDAVEYWMVRSERRFTIVDDIFQKELSRVPA